MLDHPIFCRDRSNLPDGGVTAPVVPTDGARQLSSRITFAPKTKLTSWSMKHRVYAAARLVSRNTGCGYLG